VSSVATVTGGVSGIGFATLHRHEVLDIAVTAVDLQGNAGDVADKVGQSRKDDAMQRGNGVVELLAVIASPPGEPCHL
jgi:hypothetical protein